MQTFITRQLWRLSDPLIATSIVAVLMLLALFAAGYRNERTTASGAPIVILATATLPARQATPGAVPVLLDSRPRLERAIIAYDRPAGAVIGAIETGRAYRVIGVSGDWLQLDVTESGAIWTPAAPFYGVAAMVFPTASPMPELLLVVRQSVDAAHIDCTHCEMPSDRAGPHSKP